MPTIRLTQKLQKEIGIKPADLVQAEESDAPFAEWYAHVFLINRRKQVIFVERQTLFSFTCEDVSRKDLRERLPELFEKGLGKALFIEDANGKVVKAVLDSGRGKMRFAKTRDRRTIGVINEFIKHHKFSFAYRGHSSQDRDRFNRTIITKGFPDGSKEYKMPLDVFGDCVQQLFGLKFEPKDEEFKKKIISGELNTKEIPGFVPLRAFVFEVCLSLRDMDGDTEDIIREIAVSGNESLYHLAESIVLAYGFDFDHCFGFYSDVKRKRGVEPDEVYELFVDCHDVEPTCDHAKGVEKTKIVGVFTAPGKQMRFLFDYGDDWEFIVTLKDIRPIDLGEHLPRLIKSSGRAPEQYPDYEDV